MDLKFDVQTPGGVVRRAGKAHGALANGLFAPLLLGWHSESLHQTAGLEFFYPVRAYDKTKLANISSGYASIAPAYWVTWHPAKDVEVTGTFVYLHNLKNRQTNYLSGKEFNMDYWLGFDATPAWQLGLRA